MKHLIAGLLLASAPFLTTAAVDDAQLKTAFAQVGLNVSSIADSTVPGLLQVMTDRGLFFATKDGSHLIEGQVYDLKNKVLVNEEILKVVRKAGIADLNGTVIEFKAPKEKYAVHVFTDISCGYCRKLHSELQSYLDKIRSSSFDLFKNGKSEEAIALIQKEIIDKKVRLNNEKN